MVTTKKRIQRTSKLQAVKLVLEQGMVTTQVARDLGIAHSSINRWVNEYRSNGMDSFSGKGRLLPWDEERRELEKRLRQAEIERDILKKTFGSWQKNPRKIQMHCPAQQ